MKFMSAALVASLKRQSLRSVWSSRCVSVSSGVAPRGARRGAVPYPTHREAAAAHMSTVSGDDMLAEFRVQRPHSALVGVNIALAMEALATADIVCFDVDSTVITEEGIDVLADYLGQGPQVAALTKQAMEGGMKFQDALAARLNLLQPSRANILACLEAHPSVVTPGVEALIHALRAAGKRVYLVSGGFRIMIEPLAVRLRLEPDPHAHVVANQILFDDTGRYVGFDTEEPTSQDMGKPKALQQIQRQHTTTAGAVPRLVMIGDGATDAQAKPPAHAFIGFGGVVVRESVQNVADWFVTDFGDLLHIVQTYP